MEPGLNASPRLKVRSYFFLFHKDSQNAHGMGSLCCILASMRLLWFRLWIQHPHTF